MQDSDSEDDYSGLQRQALPVDLPPDFDPSAEPQNGAEFLHHVIYEARNCEQSTYSKIDKRKIKKTDIPTRFLPPQIDCCKTVPSSNLPSEEWQQRKLADFNKLRKFVEKKRENVIKINDSFVAKIIFNDYPTYSELISSSQSRILCMLQKLLNLIEHWDACENIPVKLSYQEHMWLYGLLACLEIPLGPDTCHSLREIARNCLQKRSQLNENCADPELTYYNLIICIVGRYFNQKDLADI